MLLIFFPVGLYFLWKSEHSQTVKIIITGVFTLMIVAGSFVDKPDPSPAPIKQEDKKVDSFMSDSKVAIEKVTGLLVTDFYIMNYGEKERPNDSVDTESFAELNGDGVKRHFWANFDKNTRELRRLKIDGEVLYSTVGW